MSDEVDWGFKLDDQPEDESTATDPTAAGGASVLPQPRGPTTEEKLHAEELARRETEAKRAGEVRRRKRRRAAAAAVVGGLLSMLYFMIAATYVGPLMIFFGAAGGFLAWLVATYRLSQVAAIGLYGLVQAFLFLCVISLSGMPVQPVAFSVAAFYAATGGMIAFIAEQSRDKTENPY